MNPDVGSWKTPVSVFGTNNNALGLNMKDPWMTSQFSQSSKTVGALDGINANSKMSENDQFLNGIASQISKISINSSADNNTTLSSPWTSSSSNSPSLINGSTTIWNNAGSSATSRVPNGAYSTSVTNSWNLESGWGTSLASSSANEVSMKDLWSSMSTAGSNSKLNSQQSLQEISDKQDSQSVRSLNSGAVTPTPKSTGQISDSASVRSDISKLSNEDYINKIVNTPVNWGKIPVDQTTPWNCEDIKGKTNDFSKNFQNQVDPNVWISEPPTGTRVWEAYYESIGKKTSSWKGGQPEICNTPTPTTVWPSKNDFGGMQSPVQSNGSIFGNDSNWFDSSSNSDWSQRNKTENSFFADDASSNGRSGMNANWNPNVMKKPEPFDKMIPNPSKIMPGQNGRTGNNNRVMQMRIHAIKHLTDLGFKKEDAQHALITHNMDIERAIADLAGTKSRPIFPPNSMSGMNRMPPGNQDFNYWDGGRNSDNSSMNMSDASLPNQQEFMKQQIANQLRNAVQNPTNYYPLFQLKQTESNLKQSVHSLIEQMQIDGSLQLRQQYESTMKQLQAISKQINHLSNKTNFPPQNKPFGGGGASSLHTGGGDRPEPSMMKWSPNSFDTNPPPPPAQPYSRFMSQNDSHKAPFNSFESNSVKPNFNRAHSSQVGASQWNPLDVKPLSNTDHFSSKPNQLPGLDALTHPPMPQYPGFVPDDKASAVNNPGSVNVTEFVPGKPWQGTSVLGNDDPTMTPGSVRGLLTLNNDRLEKLIKSDMGANKPWSDNSANDPLFSQNGFPNNGRNWSMNYGNPPNGMLMDSNQAISLYLIVQNLDAHSAEFVKMTCQGTGSMTSFHPNPKAAWVLVSFVSRSEATRARQNLQSYGFQVDHLMEHEVLQYTREFSSRAF